MTLPADLLKLVTELDGADDGTPAVVASLRAAGGLPPAAFFTALESLVARRQRAPQLRNEVGYFVATLKTIQTEGHYQEAA